MRPVVNAQLGKNVRDVVLDRRFSDAELVRNLFIGVACADETKHVDFAGTQLVVASVFGQLRRNFGRNSLSAIVQVRMCSNALPSTLSPDTPAHPL